MLELLFPPECTACGQLGREPFCVLCEEATEGATVCDPVEGIDRIAARFVYGGAVVLAVQRLKYEERADLGRSLGKALRDSLTSLDEFDLAVPVPLSSGRLKKRGYNQASILLKAAGLRPCHPALRRLKENAPQVGQGRQDRLENLKGAFQGHESLVRGKRVLLVDDVLTTGATASACADALREAGAVGVQLLVLAWTDGGGRTSA